MPQIYICDMFHTVAGKQNFTLKHLLHNVRARVKEQQLLETDYWWCFPDWSKILQITLDTKYLIPLDQNNYTTVWRITKTTVYAEILFQINSGAVYQIKQSNMKLSLSGSYLPKLIKHHVPWIVQKY